MASDSNGMIVYAFFILFYSITYDMSDIQWWTSGKGTIMVIGPQQNDTVVQVMITPTGCKWEIAACMHVGNSFAEVLQCLVHRPVQQLCIRRGNERV